MTTATADSIIHRSANDARSAPPEEIAAWEACLQHGTGGSIYLHPKLVLSDLTTYKNSHVYTQAGSNGLEGVAVLCPKVIRVKPLPRPFKPVKLNGYRLVGDQIVCSEPDSIVPFVQEITKLLSAREADCLFFETVEVDSPLWKAIHLVAANERKRMRLHFPSPPQAHHTIRFPDPPADYWKKFSGKTRYNLRRSAKLFDHKFTKYSQPSDIADFIEKAHTVSTKSWQAIRIGVRVRNSKEVIEHWGRFAEIGAFRSYLLEHAGNPVAFVLGTYWNGNYTYEEIAYDQTYSRHSPGTILLYRTIEEMIENDTPQLFDFGFGDAEYKQIYSNHKSQSGPILLIRRSVRLSSYFKLQQGLGAVSKLAKAAARRVGVYSYLRRRSRRTEASKTSQGTES